MLELSEPRFWTLSSVSSTSISDSSSATSSSSSIPVVTSISDSFVATIGPSSTGSPRSASRSISTVSSSSPSSTSRTVVSSAELAYVRFFLRCCPIDFLFLRFALGFSDGSAELVEELIAGGAFSFSIPISKSSGLPSFGWDCPTIEASSRIVIGMSAVRFRFLVEGAVDEESTTPFDPNCRPISGASCDVLRDWSRLADR